jgi:glutamate 5-kinase
VDIADAGGVVIARGLVAYSSLDLGRIMGRQSREIEALLGYRGRAEIVHRDDLVLRVAVEEGAGAAIG